LTVVLLSAAQDAGHDESLAHPAQGSISRHRVGSRSARRSCGDCRDDPGVGGSVLGIRAGPLGVRRTDLGIGAGSRGVRRIDFEIGRDHSE
jgi:hypothetical protein